MIHRFGPFELDDQLLELRREGRLVAIQRKAFDGEGLAGGRGHERFAGAGDLAARAARAAIGDDGDKPTFIHTVTVAKRASRPP